MRRREKKKEGRKDGWSKEGIWALEGGRRGGPQKSLEREAAAAAVEPAY